MVFDNHGGSVDRNSVYNYKRYPIGLEADIVLGSVGFVETDIIQTIDELNNANTEQKRNHYINLQKQKINDLIFNPDNKVSNNGIEIDTTDDTNFVRINLSDHSLKDLTTFKLFKINVGSVDPPEEININLVSDKINYFGSQGEGINPHILIEFDSNFKNLLNQDKEHFFKFGKESGTIFNLTISYVDTKPKNK